MPLSSGVFYEEYHGHKIADLKKLHTELKQAGIKRFVFLAGDSSLDNKHWFFDPFREKGEQVNSNSRFCGSAVNGYEHVLQPPCMVKDVSYWLNVELSERSKATGMERIACINCAVEESCILQRETDGLLEHDEFIRDHITEDDILIVDVGGNDVALKPSAGVIVNIAWLLYLTPKLFISWGPWLAPGLWYFVNMFSTRLGSFIGKLTEKQKPKLVIPCMLYFLDEKPGGSWADAVLEKLGYDSDPSKLQEVMRQVYAKGVSQLKIPGSITVPLPLYEVLDGKDTLDYEQRVEPSIQGGQKMAKAMAEKIWPSLVGESS